MTTTQFTPEQFEFATKVAEDIHARAFFGRLAQLGWQPESEKEAEALLKLGFYLFERPSSPHEKAAAAAEDHGDGYFSTAFKCLQHMDGTTDTGEIAPGFPKAAAAQDTGLPRISDALLDGAYKAACELACDPVVYQAAVIKRAGNEEIWAAMNQESQPEGQPAETAS